MMLSEIIYTVADAQRLIWSVVWAIVIIFVVQFLLKKMDKWL